MILTISLLAKTGSSPLLCLNLNPDFLKACPYHNTPILIPNFAYKCYLTGITALRYASVQYSLISNGKPTQNCPKRELFLGLSRGLPVVEFFMGSVGLC